MWVDRGDIVLIADSQGVRDIYSADGNALDATTPLAVLVNRGTASAAEVLAGALKDSGRAAVVGGRTFGKGLIQTVVDLSDGSGMAVTLARYQTPLGIDINKVGGVGCWVVVEVGVGVGGVFFVLGCGLGWVGCRLLASSAVIRRHTTQHDARHSTLNTRHSTQHPAGGHQPRLFTGGHPRHHP